ncbi:hydroxymethylglutaryl-CoA synthase [bacterium]|nr:hydroxymethylglutaryl-CoA synthase [bacterium]
MNVGIRSYGSALPVNRLKASEILDTWKNTTPEVLTSNGQVERCVTRIDEDTLTLGLEAATRAVDNSGLNASSIDAILFGSGTNVYATKPSATILQDALGIPGNAFVTDIQFSSKSGTSAMILAHSMVKSGQSKNVLVVGADTLNLHISPGHYYEYSASAGANAFIISNEELIVEIEGFNSFSSDRNDWFRLNGERYLQCGGGFIGYRANWGLLEHTVPAVKGLMGKLQLTPDNFNHVALHQATIPPVGMVMGSLKLNPANVFRWILTRQVGDLGSAGTLMSYANILDQVEPNERTLISSLGWGSGADAISLKTTDLLPTRRTNPSVKMLLDNKQYVTYSKALKYEGKILRSMTDSHAYL